MEIKEIWKNIEGYENYQISSFGRVKSLNYKRTGKEKILKQRKDENGYLRVEICKKGGRKNYKVHRLVATAFLTNPNNLQQVNHKNEDKQCNCIENLEWCTQKYNINYGTHNERCAKALSKPIVQLSLNGEFIKYWKSAKQAERKLNINCSHIGRCCKGKHKSAGKYKWKYLSDYINEQIQYLQVLKAYRNRLFNILKKVS